MKPYTFHLDEEGLKKIKEESSQLGLSMSAWLRMIIKKELNKDL